MITLRIITQQFNLNKDLLFLLPDSKMMPSVNFPGTLFLGSLHKWQEGQDECQALGGYLAMIKTAEKQQKAKNYLDSIWMASKCQGMVWFTSHLQKVSFGHHLYNMQYFMIYDHKNVINISVHKVTFNLKAGSVSWFLLYIAFIFFTNQGYCLSLEFYMNEWLVCALKATRGDPQGISTTFLTKLFHCYS